MTRRVSFTDRWGDLTWVDVPSADELQERIALAIEAYADTEPFYDDDGQSGLYAAAKIARVMK